MMADKLLRALGNTEMAVFLQDRDLRYVWIRNAGLSWLAEAENGMRDTDLLAPRDAERSLAMKREVIRTRRPARFELRVAERAALRWYDVRIDVDYGEDGEVCGVIGTSIEITEQKRREETLRTLLRELSHRSKNLLAIIQSLASQTARHSVTVPEFLVRFRGRIQSLACSQDIVTDADWRGADLMSLVRTQVERYAPDGMRQIEVDSLDVLLSPTASLHVGLALHELAVNAASYGSLSIPGGTVSIGARFEGLDDGETLILDWKEQNGPRVRPDFNARFGTSTLERIVPNAVGGSASLEYFPDGLHYTLAIPQTQYEVNSRPAVA